jgi:hypothetical protein
MVIKMSKVTAVYDALVQELETLYPNKTRIPYPYSLQDNNLRFLIDGYGMTIGSSTFEQFEFCNFMNARDVSVVITKEVFRTDSDAHVIDDITKSLLEDIYEVQKLFYSYNELGVPNDIAKVEIGSVSEVEEVISGKQSFLSMTASFQFFIIESL